MRTGETKAEEKLEETGSDVNNLNNLIKRNLKVDLVETLSKLVHQYSLRVSISWMLLRTSRGSTFLSTTIRIINGFHFLKEKLQSQHGHYSLHQA